MTFEQFQLDIDADGIALVTWDAPGRSMNVIDLKVMDELAAIVEKVAADAAIKGAVITSGKESFCAGADLTMLEILSRIFTDMVKTRARRPPMQRSLRRAASCRCSTGGWRPAASRGSPRSTAPRLAAASSSRSPATSASRPTIRRRASACRR